MKTGTKVNLFAGACFIAGVGVAVFTLPAKSGYNITEVEREFVGNSEKEFVCEDDGKLVERHVGVKNAMLHGSRVWEIEYVEGEFAYYVQPPGETCKLEAYVPSGAGQGGWACAIDDKPVDCDTFLRTKWGGA